ncbi:MAG TPA: hypothetical protein VFB45_21345 [Pseudolabrys sp.]|nr:hypothetical protein [Pseudolabrys sp.]
MRSLWVVCLAALAVGACSTDPDYISPEQFKARWNEQNVYPASYKADVVAYMRTYLNDPTNVRGAALSEPVLKSVGPGDRYVSCIQYNAKKSSGQYAGQREAAVIYLAGHLDRFVVSNPDPRESRERPDVREVCKGVSYLPFPELQQLKR